MMRTRFVVFGHTMKLFVAASILAILGICLFGLMAVAGSSGTVRVGGASDVKDFNPSLFDSAHWAILATIYEPLITFDEDANLRPCLATDWQVDGYDITFWLREGVLFHSGKELTAQDVLDNIEFYSDISVGGHTYSVVKNVSKVSRDGKYKFTVTLEGVTPMVFLRDLPGYLRIADPDFFPLEREGVGTGPFMVKEWIPGEKLVMEKNNNYWQEGLPKTDVVEWFVFDNARAMVDALKSGVVDWILPVSFDFVEELQDNPEIVLTEGAMPFQNVFLVCPGNQNSPFSDKTVRQAMQYAIDREAIVELAFFGIGEPKTTTYWDKDPYYANDLEAYAYYDLERTRKLLQQAGYDEKNPLRFTLCFSSAFPTFTPVAELIKQDLDSIGVHVDLEVQEPTTWITNLVTGGYEATLSFMCPTGYFVQTDLRPNEENTAWKGYPPYEYREAVEVALGSLDEVAVRSAHLRIQMILQEEAWQVVISTRPQIFAYRTSIEGVARDVLNVPILHYVESIDEE